jgi:hypothetical protein
LRKCSKEVLVHLLDDHLYALDRLQEEFWDADLPSHPQNGWFQFHQTKLRLIEQVLDEQKAIPPRSAKKDYMAAYATELFPAKGQLVADVCSYEPKTGDMRAVDDTSDSPEPWWVRLRKSRNRFGLSRQEAANKLRTFGAQIGIDTIRKNEEGKHVPRPAHRKAYALAYETTESELFGINPKVQRAVKRPIR